MQNTPSRMNKWLGDESTAQAWSADPQNLCKAWRSSSHP